MVPRPICSKERARSLSKYQLIRSYLSGAGTHQGRSRQGRARQTACHAGVYREKLDQAVQIQRRGGGGRRYDWETKVAAARDRVENGMTKTEVMAKYAIASIAPLERWCREYRAGGPEALRPRPKGRPKGSKSKPKPEPTREQELAEQVAYLKAKVAYLEKLRALRADKSRGARKAPSSDCSQGGDTGSTSS